MILFARRAVLSALDISRPSHRVHDARELHQHGIAGKIDNDVHRAEPCAAP